MTIDNSILQNEIIVSNASYLGGALPYKSSLKLIDIYIEI